MGAVGDGAVEAFVMVLFAALFLAPAASADPHNYLQAGTGDVGGACVDVWLLLFNFQGEGGVCIPANHVVQDTFGEALLTVNDFSQSPTSAFFCQDPNGDATCGGTGEPAAAFCGSIYIDADVNWIPSRAINIRVHGPVFGNPVLTPCGGFTTSFGTFGSVAHS